VPNKVFLFRATRKDRLPTTSYCDAAAALLLLRRQQISDWKTPKLAQEAKPSIYVSISRLTKLPLNKTPESMEVKSRDHP
jgi:hypothetical protein